MGRKNKNLRLNYQYYVTLYGGRHHASYVWAYCKKHRCYLSAFNINERECFKKHCRYLRKIETKNQPK